MLIAERDGVIATAGEADIPVNGMMVDQQEEAPGHVSTSLIWNMLPTVDAVVERARSGPKMVDLGGFHAQRQPACIQIGTRYRLASKWDRIGIRSDWAVVTLSPRSSVVATRVSRSPSPHRDRRDKETGVSNEPASQPHQWRRQDAGACEVRVLQPDGGPRVRPGLDRAADHRVSQSAFAVLPGSWERELARTESRPSKNHEVEAGRSIAARHHRKNPRWSPYIGRSVRAEGALSLSRNELHFDRRILANC